MTHPGVFVSNVSTEAFELDPEVGGLTHTLRAEGGVEAGIWQLPEGSDAEPVMWTLPENETILVLEGTARIEVGGGPTLDIAAGDLVSLTKGLETTWHVTPGFKEFFVLS